MTLKGKCALITGSLQGLGLAAAERFAGAGCHVVLNGFGPPELPASIRERLESAFGVQTLYCGADLRRPPEIEEMVATVAGTFGGVDILVNNAVLRQTAPIEEFPVDRWDDSLAVNLSAAFHTIRLILPHMRKNNWGRIINVSSIYGLRGVANRVGYVTTKTALIGITRAVALETLDQNITCNVICPGTAETPVHDAAIQTMMTTDGLSRTEAERRFLAGRQPSGRFVAPGGVAALMLYLCGPDSADITGAALPIDGGWGGS
ncbi:MAG TPA: SDR family NAD(P)-dependent oxidoreductase [Vicinamibacterales bacterium]|jgi:3-hydroxybutyrate dehydrogenase